MRVARDALRVTALAAAACLLLVVGAVAAVALAAESVGTWEWYFRMERVVALAEPVAVALLVCAVAGGFVLVYLAPAD